MRSYAVALGSVLAGVTLAAVAGAAVAARNTGGTYSLPAGNPVLSHTPITISWANGTLSDIGTEITSSLDRSGRGGMLAPFRGVDGTVTAPAYSYTGETNSGLYRIGASDHGFSISGAKVQEWVAAGSTITGTTTANSGTTGTSATKALLATNSDNYGAWVVPRAPAASGTPLAQAGDTLLLFNAGATDTGALVVAQNSASSRGFRIDATGSTTYSGSLTATSTMTAGGDFTVKNTLGGGNVFTVAATSGNTGVSGTLNVTSQTTATGGLIIGSGANISASFRGTGTTAWGSIAAQTCSSQSITVTGAVVGSECSVGQPGAGIGAFSLYCWVSATNTCSLMACNPTSGAQTPTNGTFSCRVTNP